MKRKRIDADDFVDRIKALKFENTFNPYAETCEICDAPNGADLRRQNLRKVLTAALSFGARSMWIARDLGYRGGRRTGLALTDEVHLPLHAKLLRSEELQRATKGPVVGERTALVVWRMLQLVNEPVFLWNVFPLHPHEPENPLSNRSHSAAERDACRPLLLWILEKLKPQKIVAIGRDAQCALAGLEINAIPVRHPSYGGQNEFVSGLQKIYNLPSSSTKTFSEPALL